MSVRLFTPHRSDTQHALVDCALSLYDKQEFAELLEDRIEIGEITFTLRNDVTDEDASSEGKASPTTYA